MTNEKVDKLIEKFVEIRGWKKFHNPKKLSMSIGIEAAELMEIFQWLSIEESLNIMNTKENEHVCEEIADIMIYCISLCNQLGINYVEAILDKIKKNKISGK